MKDNIYYFIHCEVHIIVNICIGKPQKKRINYRAGDFDAVSANYFTFANVM